MTWNATLALDYTRQAEKTVAHFRHSGPLRILQSLYPEGDGICHNVIVHPPGGLVGGDTLDPAFSAGPGAMAWSPRPAPRAITAPAAHPLVTPCRRAHGVAAA